MILTKESPFQTKSILRFYDGLKKIKVERVEIKRNQECVAYANLFIISSQLGIRYSIIYDNPVYNSSHDLILLLTKIKSICAHNASIFLEVRLSSDETINKDIWESFKFIYRPWYNAVLKLDSGWSKGISDSKWRNIRSSIQLGYTFGFCENLGEFKIVYEIFRSHYRKINKPLPEKKFFNNIYVVQNSKKDKSDLITELFVTRYKSQIIAASVVFVSSNTAAQFYFASLKTNKFLHPGSFHQWSMIEWAVSRGYKWVDLVGGGEPNVYYGVREFKRRFGIKFKNVGRYSLIFKPVKYYSIKFILKLILIFKKLIGFGGNIF